jgi:hypothetical protein
MRAPGLRIRKPKSEPEGQWSQTSPGCSADRKDRKRSFNGWAEREPKETSVCSVILPWPLAVWALCPA